MSGRDSSCVQMVYVKFIPERQTDCLGGATPFDNLDVSTIYSLINERQIPEESVLYGHKK